MFLFLSRRKAVNLPVVFLLVLLTGCATTPPEGLAPERAAIAANASLVQQLSIAPVDPERQSSDPREVAEVLLAVTLGQTLANFDYLQPIRALPAHRLDSVVERIEWPTFGGTFTIPLKVRYTIRSAGNVVLHESTVESTGEASISDAFVGARRSGIALQRAIQNNIAGYLKQLAALKLPKAAAR